MKKQGTPKQICIHKSGWKVWKTQEEWIGVDDIREYHINERKFDDVAYHYLIQKDGTIQTGRPIEYMPASCKGHNNEVIAICVIGEFTRERPEEAQINALKFLILEMCKKYDIDTTMHHIFGHCDYRDPVGNRYCPGKYLSRQIPTISNWVREMKKK